MTTDTRELLELAAKACFDGCKGCAYCRRDSNTPAERPPHGIDPRGCGDSAAEGGAGMTTDTEQWRRLGISACTLAVGPAEKRTWATASEWLYKDDAIVIVDMEEVRTAADTVDRLQAEVADLKRWKQAVDDALVVSWCLSPENENDPVKALSDLAAWTQKIALDPAVSEDARALIQRGQMDATAIAQARIATLEAESRRLRAESETLNRLASNNATGLATAYKKVNDLNARVATLEGLVREVLTKPDWNWREWKASATAALGEKEAQG